jgi:hypothetical protein
LRRVFIFLFTVSALYGHAQPHPVVFANAEDIAALKAGVARYPLLAASYADLKSQVDSVLGKEVDVPFPKDPAGGYTHDKHKSNYILMFNSGILYNITGKPAYAMLVKQLLLKYAALNPVLRNHPQATSPYPGRLFWQALNDANWLVYAGIAYDLVYNTLSAADRKVIEEGAFKPEVDYLTKDLKGWFDLIHNHSVWACAGVGIVGLATNNAAYVDMALYGSAKDGKSGFLAQMDNLFSPDGYYTEGPYYVRYAILPYMLFANALRNARPGMQIFERRNRILQKALNTCLQQTNTDGVFFPLNDALKNKDYTTNELVTAIDIAWSAYPPDSGLLFVVKKQNRVLLHRGGLSIAKAMASAKQLPAHYPYKTIESTDGAKGDQGGVSILRSGSGEMLSSLVFKYTAQGLSHGHFDKLNINFFDKGNEVLTDYGAVRFIGVEQKFGGRYLPENTAYAAQTIAHNTLVADEQSHFGGNPALGERYHSEKLFSDTRNPDLQVVAARDDNAIAGVKMERTEYLLRLPGGEKMIIDLLLAESPTDHTYDLPFHYSGQFINASFPYHAFNSVASTLGKSNGYQYLWKRAVADVDNTTAQVTFLNGNVYYSLSTLITDAAQILFTESGAGDSAFNLRHEPAVVVRKKGSNQCFLSVLELHGHHDPVNEFSHNAYPGVKSVRLLHKDSDYLVAEINVKGKQLLFAQSRKDFNAASRHHITAGQQSVEWTGPYTVVYGGAVLDFSNQSLKK